MKAIEIANALKKRYPEVFSAISRQTIEDWIDRGESRPKWKDSTLRRVGFDPQYNTAGRKHILVSYCEYENGVKAKSDLCSPLIPR